MAKRQFMPLVPAFPTVSSIAQLPNVAGSSLQTAHLEAGDGCYVGGSVQGWFVCIDPTLGAAQWSAMLGNTVSQVSTSSATLDGAHGTYVITHSAGIVTLTINPLYWAVGSTRAIQKSNTGAFSIVLAPPGGSSLNGAGAGVSMTLPGSSQDSTTARGDMVWTVTRLTSTTYRVAGGAIGYFSSTSAQAVAGSYAQQLGAAGNGSVGSPAIWLGASANNGFWFDATKGIVVSLSGATERLNVRADGRLDLISGAAATTAVVRLTSTSGSADTFVCSGSPEGVITASPGAEARDITNGIDYTKRTGTGNTGWVQEAVLSDLAALIDTADPLSVYPSYQTINVTSRYTDFATVNAGFSPYNAVGSGTGNASAWSTAIAGRHGLVTLETGTTTAGSYFIGMNSFGVAFGSGVYRWRGDFWIPTASDGTDTFSVRAGFIDATSGECTDGVYFRYQHSVNGGRWEFVTRNNSVETATDTGVAGVAAIASMEIEVNAGGTSANARINGTSVATNTTNIPTGATRSTGIGLAITKSAGTNNRTIIADLMGDRFERTTAI